MATQLKWLGHGCWLIETGGTRILLDPFLNDQPTAPCKADDVEAEYILISHGHFDHVADAASIAARCQSTIVSNFEITSWFEKKHGIARAEPMNLGGAVDLPFGRVQLVPAWHSSQLPDGSDGGNPGGFLLQIEGANLYFACDTALFSEMQWIGERDLAVAVLPIGDRFTMGPADAVTATKWLRPKVVIPNHYNTWPPIEQDAEAWAEQIGRQTQAKAVVLKPGECYTVDSL